MGPWGQRYDSVRKLTEWLCCPAGSMPQLSFTEDISAGEDDQTLSPGRPKKTDSKLSEKPGMEEEAGERSLQSVGCRGGV